MYNDFQQSSLFQEIYLKLQKYLQQLSQYIADMYSMYENTVKVVIFQTA